MNKDTYSYYDDNNMVITSGKKTTQHKQNAPGTKKFRELDSNEIVDLEKVVLSDAKKLQQLRNECKLSQTELAKKFSIQGNDIRDFENGKSTIGKVLFNKMIRYLQSYKSKELPKI
jgi:ribosome-binding protein aMBF1 (putative translation factor)